MKQIQDSERARKKQEKRKLKLRKKRRKRLNAKIDRTVSLLALLLCILFSALDVMERKGLLPWKRRGENMA